MRITTIGSGTAAPSAGRVSSGHHVDCGDARVLLDCGSGVVHRMAALGMQWQSITHVVVTHFHNDHISDIPTLILAWRHGMLPARSAPVTFVGPPGTRALLDRMAAAFGEGVVAPGFPLLVHELDPGNSMQLADGVLLTSRAVPHTAESVAYSLATPGRRIVYTGDTGYDETLGDWAAGCDLLLAECSLPSEMAIASHLTPEQCGLLAARARPATLALTHFYPPVERVDISALVAVAFDGPVALTVDGWTMDLEE